MSGRRACGMGILVFIWTYLLDSGYVDLSNAILEGKLGIRHVGSGYWQDNSILLFSILGADDGLESN